MSLDASQAQFVIGVSTATRIDPRVIVAWMQQEGANAPGGTGGFNYLNLRPEPGDEFKSVSTGGFEQFASVTDAIGATVNRLNKPFARPIIATARTKPTPSEQINAIAATGWDSSHYGGNGGQNLLKTFTSIFKNPNDSYVGPAHAREIANTATTGSAADAGSVDIGGAATATKKAAKATVEAIPGVKAFESIGGVFSWVGDNWDRILWVVGGFILLLLGLALLAGKTKVSQMNPATKFPKTAKKG